MNYRHIYHAGNFCDVVKHCILLCLIESYVAKNKPFCYFDTHAGIGLYDLESEPSRKSKEWQQGVAKILAQTQSAPEVVADYINCIHQCNVSATNLQYYPGSPYLAKLAMSPEDSIILNELHPEDAIVLKSTFASDSRVSVHKQDAYQALKALLPPPIKRGLILIDPPFEQPNEFEKILDILPQALKRFANGCYAIWYPIKDSHAANSFVRKIKALTDAPILNTQLTILPEDSRFQLNGTGMILINPPWQIEQKLEPLLAWLWQIMSIDGQGSYQVEFL